MIETLKKQLAILIAKLNLLIKTMPGEHIYQTAKAHLGQHLTLDPNVPPETGCAEAVSTVLKLSGYYIPRLGIAGTKDLCDFLANSKAFTEVTQPVRGDIWIYPSGQLGSKVPHGHTGICGDVQDMSNDSATGLFEANYTHEQRVAYFENTSGFTPRYFRAII